MSTPPTQPALAASAGSAHLVEEWECRACHKEFPCRVQIHFSPAFTDMFSRRVRFFRRPCIAGEPIVPEWKMNPIREESPNAVVSDGGTPFAPRPGSERKP